MNLAKIDGESLTRAAKRDKDLRCSARAAIQASRIDFSSGFPVRFARKFAAFRCPADQKESSHKLISGVGALAPTSKDTQNRALAPEEILLFLSRPFMKWPLVNRTYLTRKATLNQIDKTHRLLYFLCASKRLPPVTARPGDARGQGKEPY